jgi:hypothetical protein
MTCDELTGSDPLAKSLPMQGIKQQTPWSGWRAVRAAMMLAGGSLAISGCISVSAPDKPIVIELNINIKQEVIYRLAADAANTIEKNPEIF